MTTSSFACSDKPRQSASRQHNLRMGNSHSFYQGIASGLSRAGHAYRNTTARSYALCSVYCLLSDECKSFNYCVDDKLCQLNSAVYSGNEDMLMESSGCLYFDEMFHEEKDLLVGMSGRPIWCYYCQLLNAHFGVILHVYPINMLFSGGVINRFPPPKKKLIYCKIKQANKNHNVFLKT